MAILGQFQGVLAKQRSTPLHQTHKAFEEWRLDEERVKTMPHILRTQKRLTVVR
jgi:hypothetical protein